MKQVFTLIEFEYDREVLPTEIQAAITKLLGVYPVKVERRPTPLALDGGEAGHWLDISSPTYQRLAELREKSRRQ